MKTQTRLFFLVAAFAATIGTSQAALLVYEGFDYTAGNNQTGLNGGTGWSGSWTATDITSPNLTYGDLITVGNAANAGNNPERTLATPLGGANQTIWLSLLTDANAANVNFYLLGSTHPSPVDYLGFNLKGGLDTVVTTLPTTTAPASNFVLTKLEFNASNTSVTASLWANPIIANGEGGLGTPTTTGTKGAVTTWNMNRFVFAGGATWDEFRIGTTFADVTPVPEPSTWLLLATSVAVIAVLRRRHNRTA